MKRLLLAKFYMKRGYGLVATAATAAATTTAVTTTATATASTAAAVATATAAAAATTATESTATTTTAATAAVFLRLGFIDGQSATAMFLAVERRDGCLGFIVAAHFDESETLATAGVPIGDDLGALDSPVSGKQLFQRRAIDIVAQISDIQLLAHLISL
jgi:hypothetical protein